jgi:hypothetical protein
MRTLFAALVLMLVVAAVVVTLFLAGMAKWQPEQQFRSAIAGEPAARDVVMQMSEDYLNVLIAREIAKLQDRGLTRVVADIRPDGLVDTLVEGKLELGPLGVTGKVLLHNRLSVDKGRLVVAIQGMEVAGIGITTSLLPASMRQTFNDVAAVVNSSIENTLKRQGLAVQTISTTNQTITVELIRE